MSIVIKSLSGQRCFCVTLKEYLAGRNKTYKNSHPCDWNPWLFHIQMFKALMQQSPVLKTVDLRQLGTEHPSNPTLQQTVYLTSRALYASKNRFLPLMLQYTQPKVMKRQKEKKYRWLK